MKTFNGFPTRTQFTPIPSVFFSRLLPQITDIAELKVTLYLFHLLYYKRGYPRFVSHQELLTNQSLTACFEEAGRPPQEALGDALEKAVKRGTVLHIVLDRDGTPEDVYFLNTESDRRVVAKIRDGELALAGLKAGGQTCSEIAPEPLPDIFTLYEENIGMLTPLIAEELQEAEKLYPQDWIRDAIKEAVKQGKRKWSYISAILESWSTEGRGDGTHQRDFKKADPDKYLKGKYGYMVQH